MEQVSIQDGTIRYGKEKCRTYDELYRRIRDDYHSQLGTVTSLRLNRLGSRQERLHSYGFVFSSEDKEALSKVGFANGYRPVYAFLMGIVDIGYSRGIGIWDYGHIKDDDFDDWFDWLFSRGNRMLRTRGLHSGYGRTSKRLRTRYK